METKNVEWTDRKYSMRVKIKVEFGDGTQLPKKTPNVPLNISVLKELDIDFNKMFITENDGITPIIFEMCLPLDDYIILKTIWVKSSFYIYFN